MKKLVVLVVMLLISSNAFADSCFPVDASGWTQTRKNHVVAASYQLISESGVHNFVVIQPFDGTQVCVRTQDTIPDGTITATTVLARIQQFEADWAAAAAAEQALLDSANNELLGNAIQTMSIDDASAWLDTQYAPVEAALASVQNLTQAKAVMADFMALDKAIKKKIAKYIITKEIQRGQR